MIENRIYPLCEVIGRYFLPVFRSLVAKELIEKYKFTQTGAAEKLGTTQAAISQYIHSKRGSKAIEQFEGSLPKIQTIAIEIARDLATGKMSGNQVTPRFCKLCTSLQEELKPRSTFGKNQN